jgi:hypothetical protein
VAYQRHRVAENAIYIISVCSCPCGEKKINPKIFA